MHDDQTNFSAICRSCGCTEAQAAADAQALGFQREFQTGIHTCCQVVQWADEQWLAWREAAAQDGRPVDEVTRPLEISESDALFVPVHNRSQRANSGSGGNPAP